MKIAWGMRLCVSALLVLAAGARAQPVQPPSEITTRRPAAAAKTLTFDSLTDVFPTGSTKLVNGTLIVDLSAWSAVLIARLDSGAYCSATIIGPRVMLTAAHCVDAGFGKTGETIGGRINIAGTQYTLTSCTMHPAYAAADRGAYDIPRMSTDFALCELDGTPSITSETVIPAAMLGKGSQMLMTGFGCTGIHVVANSLAYDIADQAGSERLRLGDARIEAVDVSDAKSNPGSYLRTRSVRNEPILCPGDSGGPAISGASLALQSGPLRRIIGVNSMVTALPNGTAYDYLSYIASIGTKAFADFAKSWTAQSPMTRAICGREIPAGTRPCRA